MLAEMTLSKGKLVSPSASLALYSSDRTASSPLTAYLASFTCGFMLLMFKLRRGVVDDIARRENCCALKREGMECCEFSG